MDAVFLVCVSVRVYIFEITCEYFVASFDTLRIITLYFTCLSFIKKIGHYVSAG